MGVMSKRVLPVCGSICTFCPALRARSRQPVKRYKKLLTEIFPKKSVLIWTDREHGNWESCPDIFGQIPAEILELPRSLLNELDTMMSNGGYKYDYATVPFLAEVFKGLQSYICISCKQRTIDESWKERLEIEASLFDAEESDIIP